jgi:hypothetical protein
MNIDGKKDVKVYGEAADGATSVNLNVASSIKRISDSSGYFELDVDTGGVPEGEFVITVGGIRKDRLSGCSGTNTNTISQSNANANAF